MKQYRLLALFVGSRLPNRAMNSLALSPLDQQFNEDKRLPCQRLKKWRGTDEGGYTGCGKKSQRHPAINSLQHTSQSPAEARSYESVETSIWIVIQHACPLFSRWQAGNAIFGSKRVWDIRVRMPVIAPNLTVDQITELVIMPRFQLERCSIYIFV